MDEAQLTEEGYSVFGKAGAGLKCRVALCMGNQARVADKATVFSNLYP